MQSRFSRRAFLTILLALLLWACGGEGKAGQDAPDFKLQDLAGNEVTLSRFRGSIVILDFWATWCPPCRQSIPELVELQNKYGKKGVVILGVSMDDPKQAPDPYMTAFKDKFKINYTILRANGQVSKDYFGTSQMAIPTMFVINRKGKIVDKFVGFKPGAIEASIRKQL
jgi:peroxiredoxin